MPAITSENRDAWQAIANDCSKQRPYVGRLVKIVEGRKHKGKQGKVVRHMLDKYFDAFRYGSEASHHLTQMMGRHGYVVLVEQECGNRFWVRADYTLCMD